MRNVEFGVFMPVGTNGFLMSKHAPRYEPTFALHREIALTAEAVGLDYLFWMGKWMGFGGETGFWENTIEPMSFASAIASMTTRLKLFSTINPLLYHPAVAAKIIATIDDVSQGRFGVNVVTGNTLEEIEQLGVVPADYASFRYEYAGEWMDVVKSLWSRQKTTHDGRFFHLKDCVSGPKPIRKPYPIIVSAGLSDAGLAFAAKHSDYQFVGTRPAYVQRVKAAASSCGRTIRGITTLLLIQGETDAEAQAKFDYLRDGLDYEARDNLIASYAREDPEGYFEKTAFLRAPDMLGLGAGTAIVGSGTTIAEKVADMIADMGFDAIQFTFVDFVEGLKSFGKDILPELKARLAERDITTGSAALS
jgi:pyrimidine oxygenase